MTWAIVADSSCNLRDFQPTAPDCSFALAPLKIMVAGDEYVDDATLDVSELNRRVAHESSASGSACPSVGEWSDLFRLADNVIAITISSNLSGSFEAAQMAKKLVLEESAGAQGDEIPSKNIFVLDSRAAGGKLEVIVHLLDRYLKNNPGCSFEDAVSYAEQLERHSQVQFSLSRYDNLMKNGRMPKLVGALASGLSIRMLGTATEQGTIKVIAPTRGDKKTFRKIVEFMRTDGFKGGVVYINHVQNETGAQGLKNTVLAEWPQAEVEIVPCGGLCSYYAEETGLIIGYEWLEN